MRRNGARYKFFGVRIPPEYLEELASTAKESGQSQSAFIRSTLIESLERNGSADRLEEEVLRLGEAIASLRDQVSDVSEQLNSLKRDLRNLLDTLLSR